MKNYSIETRKSKVAALVEPNTAFGCIPSHIYGQTRFSLLTNIIQYLTIFNLNTYNYLIKIILIKSVPITSTSKIFPPLFFLLYSRYICQVILSSHQVRYDLYGKECSIVTKRHIKAVLFPGQTTKNTRFALKTKTRYSLYFFLFGSYST